MSLRIEFVRLAQRSEIAMSELCRRFGISRETGYKWVRRFAAEGAAGLSDQSRRPRLSPRRTAAAVALQVTALRRKHPAWGGRKLRRRLQDAGVEDVPAASTITDILHREGLIAAEESGKHRAFLRFESEAPNRTWQMDYKGHIPMETGRCHPLTVLDDHSRFALGLIACNNERTETVQQALIEVFRRYGLPWRFLTDNGPPWGDGGGPGFTALAVWLLRLGIAVSHGRPYHPQTQGKDERFHRTLNAELLRANVFRDQADSQRAFDAWRTEYNHERPHEALGLAVPASRYQISPRPYPERLPSLDYGPGVLVRKVNNGGKFSYRGSNYSIPKAFDGYPIGLRITDTEDLVDVLFGHQVVLELNLRSGIATKPAKDVPAHLSGLTPV
jgi:transposase InsO family protein